MYASPAFSFEVGNVTLVLWPPPTILVCAITRASPVLDVIVGKAGGDAVAGDARDTSPLLASTQLWPMACAGSLPE